MPDTPFCCMQLGDCPASGVSCLIHQLPVL
jgi:hypothetical protein